MKSKETKRVLVFSGNYKEAQRYARLYKLKEWKYLTSFHDLYGHQGNSIEVHLTGTYEDRPNFNEIKEEIQLRKIITRHWKG